MKKYGLLNGKYQRNGNQISYCASKYFWLVALIICGTAYYATYLFSVIPPQTGWWQYMAQRLSDGEMLYRDVFLYVPPYFAWLTAGLYQIFGNCFIAYTLFGYIFFRIIPWVFCYIMLTRFVKPSVSAWGVLVSLCITSSYLMDQAYDYNPLIMGLVLLQTYLLLRAHESSKGYAIHVVAVVEGVLCGAQLMLKQNVGIIMPIVTIPLLIYIAVQKGNNRWYLSIVEFLFGFALGVLPGILYLFFTDTLDDCWWCITTALNAKMGEDNILLVAIRNFYRKNDLVVAVLLGASYLCAVSKKDKLRSCAAPLIAISVFVLTMVYIGYIDTILNYLNTLSMGIKILLLLVFVSVLVLIAGCFTIKKLQSFCPIILTCIFGLIFLCAVAILPKVSNNFAEYFYHTVGWSSIKKHILYTMLYFDILMWFEGVYKGIIKRDPVKIKFTICYTVFMAFMAVSFASASLEELYALMLVPGITYAIYQCISVNKNQENETNASSILISTITIGVSVFICSMCLIQKVYMPYEWHSWRTASLLSENNPITDVTVNGLEGFNLPQSDVQKYQQIVDLILENSTEDDVLYQFPNIPLFNVLTNRKSLYVPIPYFDVCPDSLAIESAEILKEEPPKLVLWAKLSDGRWSIHEEVFRGGKASGQRAIQEFYNTVVVNEYTLLGSFSNNEGESIELWKRN